MGWEMAKLGRFEKKAMLSERHSEEGMRRARSVLNHVDMVGKRDYLELGCGGGHVVRYIASTYGLACTGTDVDPDMVRNAEERSEGMEDVCFMTVDATDLPFENGSYDLALSFGILHHIADWRSVFDEVSRVLRPGGDYVLGDFCYSKFSSRLLRPFVTNYGVYTADDLVEQASTSGLDVAWRGLPRGTFFKYHAMVLTKVGD